MVIIFCLFWIGLKLSAPIWYFVLLGLVSLIHCIKFGMHMGSYSIRIKNDDDDDKKEK